LAADISRDALGQLATAIDAYQARLVDADAHEQAFLADASHELRTPLTVIQGVTEVLLDEPATATTQRSRLLRLERGVGDMGQLLEAMLASARRKPLLIETVNMRSLLQAAAAHAVVGKPAVQLCIEGEATVHTAQREALLLLSGLLRVLLQAQPCERVFVQLAMPLLVLRLDTSPDTPPDTPHDPAAGATASFGTRHRADTSTGSALLDRLATRLHWQVQLQSSSHARLLLADTPAA
jgi:signal transduction histidine kinase